MSDDPIDTEPAPAAADTPTPDEAPADETPPAEPAPTEPAPPDEPDAPGIDDAKLAAELKRARNEAAKYRTEAAKLRKAEEERARAEMSELERAKADAEAAQANIAAMRQAVAEAEIRAAAATANFADPADAIAFVASRVTYDDDGRPVDVDKLVKALAADKPHLVKRATPGGGTPTNPARRSSTGSERTDAQRLAETLRPSQGAWYDRAL